MHEKKVLVTGGAGFIGSHACKALFLAGYLPVTVDDLSTGSFEAVKWGPLIKADIGNKVALGEIFQEHDFVGILHFAAKAYVGESTQKPIWYYERNISTTALLLEVALVHDVRNIVFSSSCAVYGNPAKTPIFEDLETNPINPYGFTKLACEKLLQFASISDGVKYAILRYFNSAGSDPDFEIGEKHTPETHLIPLALSAARKGEIFTIYGGDYDTTDGTALRDYIHVSDLAVAHVSALERILEGGDSFTCNLGTGVGYTVLEILAEVKRRYPGFEWSYGSRRFGDPATLVANADLANKLLGWEPQNSNLANILDHTIEWQQRSKIMS